MEEALLSEVGIKLALGVSLGDLDGCRDDGCKPGREREDEQEHGGVFEVHGVILSFFLMGVKGFLESVLEERCTAIADDGSLDEDSASVTEAGDPTDVEEDGRTGGDVAAGTHGQPHFSESTLADRVGDVKAFLLRSLINRATATARSRAGMVLAIDGKRGFRLSILSYEDNTRGAVVSGDTVSMVEGHAGVERLRSEGVAIIDAEEVVVVHFVSLSF